jgi:hypothetical protein
LGAQPETRRAYGPFEFAAIQLWDLWLLTGLGSHVVLRPAPQPIFWDPLNRWLVLGLAAAAWLVPLWMRRHLQPLRLGLIYWVLIQLVPPMVLSFIAPVTDRYLFLPSVGVCILVADVAAGFAARRPKRPWLARALVPCLAAFWAVRSWSYLGEWADPRSLWFGAARKSEAPQVCEYLGEVYQEAGDRLQEFVRTGKLGDPDREAKLAQAVTGDPARVAQLAAEWGGPATNRAASRAWRDQLWTLAWEQFERGVARRNEVNMPNLFLRRGKLLVDQGKPAAAIPELMTALELARTHTYERVRQENVTHIARALSIAYWNQGKFADARQWLLEAQRVQRASGTVWVPTLDQEVEKVTRLADGQK